MRSKCYKAYLQTKGLQNIVHKIDFKPHILHRSHLVVLKDFGARFVTILTCQIDRLSSRKQYCVQVNHHLFTRC